MVSIATVSKISPGNTEILTMNNLFFCVVTVGGVGVNMVFVSAIACGNKQQNTITASIAFLCMICNLVVIINIFPPTATFIFKF